MDENKTFNISMPKALLDAIDKQAEVEIRNRSDLIREAVRTYITQNGGMSLANNLTDSEEDRVKGALKFSTFSEEPAIIISCTLRPQPNSIDNIFAADSTSIRLMEKPSKIRNMGWDLGTLDRARPVAGEYLEVANGKRKLLRLYRDGQHVFAAGMDFFGHAVNNSSQSPKNFNLLAVAEVITNFVDFSEEISETSEIGKALAIFTIVVSNPQSAPHKEKRETLELMAYDGVGVEKAGELDLPWAERNIVIRAEDKLSSDRIAYLIYSEFCYFFGSRSDELWYVNKTTKEINRDNFKRIMG